MWSSRSRQIYQEYIYMQKNHVENWLKAGRRPLTQPKLQKRSPYNRVGWWREGIRTGLTPLGGVWRRRAHAGGPSPWGAPLPAGRSAGTEGGVGGLGCPSGAHLLASWQ